MNVLASCSYEESKNYNGKLTVPSDSGKPSKVFLNIVCSTEEVPTVFNECNGSVKCITVTEPCSVPEKWKGRVFIETGLDSLDGGEFGECVPLVRLPDGYNNMLELYNVSTKHPGVRFIGGNLLAIGGVLIGRFDEGKEGASPVYNGVYDTFIECGLSELDSISCVKGTDKQPKVKSPTQEKRKSPAVKKVKVISTMFGDSEESF